MLPLMTLNVQRIDAWLGEVYGMDWRATQCDLVSYLVTLFTSQTGGNRLEEYHRGHGRNSKELNLYAVIRTTMIFYVCSTCRVRVR